MSEYHQIIDQIRGIVQASDQTRNDRMAQLAADYATACAEVNQRLGRCQWLLQQGLRSEAIQLADSEPRLLDAVGELDFPERSGWDELVGAYGLAAAPALLMEAAGFLNEAYAQEEPLQNLLVRHRRLAMQRAPLRLRLGVIRQLAAQDANNLVWGDDLRGFEKARFRQIQIEAAEAARLRDPAHLARLLAEVQQQTWAEPPPKVLVQGLVRADAQLRGQKTRAALAELDSRLNDAFAARDPIRGRIARNEWIALTASEPPDPDDPIWGRVGSALAWLDDEDRRDAADRGHESALAALIETLDDPAFVPPDELERLGQAVLAHGRGIPEELQQRFLSRLRTAESSHSRRFRLIVSGSVAAGLLVAGLVFALVRWNIRDGESAKIAVSISDLVELGEIDRAGDFVKALEKSDPGLLEFPPMIEALQRFNAAQTRETERQVRFDKALREAEQAPLGIADPKALAEAREMARRETETQAIDRLAEKRRAALLAERARHETVVRPRIEEIRQGLYEIDRRFESPPVDEAAIDQAISRHQRTFLELTSELDLIGDELRGLAQDSGQRLEKARNRLAQAHRLAGLLEEATTASAYSTSGKKDAAGPFARALEAYIQADPTSPRALAFQDVLKERPIWESLEAWSRLTAEWKPGAQGLPPGEARTRADICAQFLRQYPAFPDATAVAAYQHMMEAIERRAPGKDGNPQSRILRLFSDILVDNVWMVAVTDREVGGRLLTRRYYTTGRPAEKANYLQFLSLDSFGGNQKARIISRSMIVSVDRAPQSRIAADFKPALADEARLAQWEKVMRELLARILNEPEIDPILQVSMLRRVLDSAAEGSEPLKEAFGPFKDQLNVADVDINIPWMNPETDNLERNRQRAEQAVEQLRRLLPQSAQIDSLREKMERGIDRTYTFAGWLSQVREVWEVRAGAKLPREGELWVVLPVERTARLRKLGHIEGGRPVIEARDGATLAEGRPIFLVREAR